MLWQSRFISLAGSISIAAMTALRSFGFPVRYAMKAVVLGLALVGLTAGVALADGDPAAGKTVFGKCAACHSVGDGAKNRVGPVLNDLFGSVAGTVPSFNFSAAMVQKGKDGLVWTPETFAQFITKPQAFVPGTKMPFAGLPNATDVANVTAYLLTFSPNYSAAPAAAAPGAPAAAPAAPAPASSSAAQ
jgi:cytochrome c